MNSFTHWCYRIGLMCGLLAMLITLIVIPFESEMSSEELLNSPAAQAFSIFACIFMFMGFVLLIEAIVWLKRSWPHLSKATKVVSILGLLTSTIVGAYLFHWLFPSVVNHRPQV